VQRAVAARPDVFSMAVLGRQVRETLRRPAISAPSSLRWPSN
jgi:hypothetical protein